MRVCDSRPPLVASDHPIETKETNSRVPNVKILEFQSGLGSCRYLPDGFTVPATTQCADPNGTLHVSANRNSYRREWGLHPDRVDLST